MSAVAVLLLALAPAPAQQPKPADPKATTDGAADLAKRLAARVTLDKAFEGKFPDAVKMLAEKFDLPLTVDREVLRYLLESDDGVEQVPGTVRLPKLADVKLETLLTILCDQANAKFLVYPDRVRIATLGFWLYETRVRQDTSNDASPADPNDPNAVPILSITDLEKSKPLIKRAVVTKAFKAVAVSDILDEIATGTGATVNLSPLVGNKADTRLTVRFANTPVDAAVRTVCELADLGVIEDANTLTVTTRERAAEVEKKAADKAKAKLAADAALNPQQFFGNGLLPARAERVAGLKDEIAALKAEVEELRKALKK
ncbi:MAG: hypothetical protein C0501_15105 [Isosphaera sp.]|nr:hypothetical protein [Isosphaera sp.]